LGCGVAIIANIGCGDLGLINITSNVHIPKEVASRDAQIPLIIRTIHVCGAIANRLSTGKREEEET
jgi:hypothetical protein